jgi:Asp/Glu/hydantoin racemase
MPYLLSAEPERPRILIINPNSSTSFSIAMQSTLTSTFPLDFFTPSHPASPLSIEGTTDSIISAAACLHDLSSRLDEWDGFIVACFSAHPLTLALRELTATPVVGILDTPLLMASQLGSNVGILTTSPRWVPLLTHDIHALHIASLNTAGVVSSGLSVLDLEHLPREQVLSTLGKMAKEELVEQRQADVIVLGCAGMVGLDTAIRETVGKGVVILDPVRCALEVLEGLVRMKVKTAKRGIYAEVK